MLTPTKRPAWQRVDRLLGELGIQRDDAVGRRRFAEAMEEPRGRDAPGEWKTVRRGWFLGGAELKARLLEQMEQGVGEHQSWDGKRETEESKAERIVAEELRRRRWAEGKLKERRKTDPEKVKVTQRLRQETVMTLDWIAKRSEMGCRHTLGNCLKEGRVDNSRD